MGVSDKKIGNHRVGRQMLSRASVPSTSVGVWAGPMWVSVGCAGALFRNIGLSNIGFLKEDFKELDYSKTVF